MLRQLRSGRHHAKLDACEGPTLRFLEWGAASHLLYFMCCDFPDFGHKAKYAPFGMLGKPKSAVIIKGVTTPASATSAPSSSESFPWGCCRAHTGHHLPCHRHAHGH